MLQITPYSVYWQEQPTMHAGGKIPEIRDWDEDRERSTLRLACLWFSSADSLLVARGRNALEGLLISEYSEIAMKASRVQDRINMGQDPCIELLDWC